VEQEIIILMEQ
jgi:hypothetical protein